MFYNRADLWCSWLAHSPHTRKVLGSIPNKSIFVINFNGVNYVLVDFFIKLMPLLLVLESGYLIGL